MKRYRSPKVSNDQIKLQRGKVNGDVDIYIFFGAEVPKCDRALIYNYMCSDNHNYSGGTCNSLICELEKRGYDIDTLRFSIEKKEI